jgi:GxxExxY protein
VATCLLPTTTHHEEDKGHKGKIRGFLMTPNQASHAVIGAAIRVHQALGAGMLEKTIELCLLVELREAGLHVQQQVRLPVLYKAVRVPLGYRIDFIVENCLIVEIKCVEKLLPVHTAQVISYLKLTGLKLGLLINFNVPRLRDGIRRIINGPAHELDLPWIP